MPDVPLTPGRLRIKADPEKIAQPERTPFVELGLVSCFSFLRGASHPVKLVETAHELGYDAIGIADANSMAGVVRIHTNAKELKLTPVIGCRIETVEGLAFLAYPTDRAAYGRLCRLISAGRMGTLTGEWQAKGVCEISLPMLAAHSEGVQLILLPPANLDAGFTIEVESNVIPFPKRSQRRRGAEKKDLRRSRSHPSSLAGGSIDETGSQADGGQSSPRLCASASANPSLPISIPSRELTAPFSEILPHLTQQLPTLRHLAASYLYTGDDIARIDRLDALAKANGLALLATNDVHYHKPERRPLQDVMTAIRHKTTVAAAGHLLHANGERHLKPPQEMQRLFARWPHAIAAAREVADACRFTLDELKYEYPQKGYPEGLAGTDIPIEARIVAVADVFDALCSERPYKPAWPVEAARLEIRRGSGTQFDPRCVAAFEARWPEIAAIFEEGAGPSPPDKVLAGESDASPITPARRREGASGATAA